jgi:radical SAM protein with 4Fe4S-binding SPASM domain
MYHLNATAAYMAYLYLQGEPDDQAASSLAYHYQVSLAQAQIDYQEFRSQVVQLAFGESCPLCDLALDTIAPFTDRPSAPYRMDLAVTYRCNNNCAHCYNARPRSFPEWDTGHWTQTLDRLWSIGIPHIVFTGGEPTLRDDLPELIAHAEGLGQITGINTNGRRLQDMAFLRSLVDAGLDHIQITFESHDAAIHNHMVANPHAWEETRQGLENALHSGLFVMTNTTLLQSNRTRLAETLHFLGLLGVPTVGLNALIYSGHGANVGTGLPEAELPALLETAREITQYYHQRLIWYTPTQYCHFDPMQMELGVKGCSAALYNMCIDPDGSVIPCQSYYQSLGNILADPWEKIWNHDLAVSLRERKGIPAACHDCALLPECGGGCPLAQQTAHSSPPKPVPVLPA